MSIDTDPRCAKCGRFVQGPICIPCQSIVSTGQRVFTITPPAVPPIPLDERKDLNQAILALDYDIRRHEDIEGRWEQKRVKSDREAIEILKRYNLPNPPAA